MKFNMIVLVKQVPDTRCVGKDAMKADGTVNRAALPAIFNPEDLNALEQALLIKDQHPESTITLLTMGPPRAAEILREGLFRGANSGILITDRIFAGADTLATSYALACAIKQLGKVDLIFAGRQAIDGDTAQVGPQVAQKLQMTAITYAEKIEVNDDETLQIRRRLDKGVEVVRAKLPLLITVNGSAAPCRPRNAKLLQRYKHAKTASEQINLDQDYLELYTQRNDLHLAEWNGAQVQADPVQCGLSGSPTKVKTIENVSFQSKENKRITAEDQLIEDLMIELMNNHTLA